MNITKALLRMGYTEFVVRGDTYDGIEWVVEPDTVPSEEEVLDMVSQLDVLEQAELDAKATQKAAILERLGLTEDELRVVLS
jgi:hypothetical protein